MENLRDFASKFGLSAIIRRHFRYEVPASLEETVSGYPTRGALTYTRIIERNLLPLTPDSCKKAFEQARSLVELGIIPTRVNCGTDQRNIDGARWSAAGIGNNIRWYQSPAWTYPYYTDVQHSRKAIERYGDLSVHRYLADAHGVSGLWTETRETFSARIITSVLTEYPERGPVLWDLNYEQMVVIYYRLLSGVELDNIPYEGEVWQPSYGGGVAISSDCIWAVEFNSDLSIVGLPRQIRV
jgi:hypothetical protein